MAGEATTIARPYAEAVFARADESDSLASWSDALTLLAQVVEEPAMKAVISNPKFDQARLSELLIEIGGEQLAPEARNLVRLLVQNGRLRVMPEIAGLFEALKAEKQRILNVHVRSAFALDDTQEKQIADALKAKLGRDVTITSEEDATLLGGVHIRAGDMVIDGSVSGQLQQLANELGI
ncbi:MAG: F0F1 ATP synthase subunit delta [Candidatus Sedimenticola endophacoides]|uniref:ATP synthase subunit delta n=1 Tax=Candidatus Sedimenticola endophacoides TaxID=2548426 RepID=A0A657PXW6_9GAMM|nr:MAG: F0F1 ATP synthase subunit delta [Candidatus Sedimenticola endophacoides]OQX37113.1 MAG: F0F1 ATP synthase subunit delta [Candidatus Sedimenticola endophacoides]OQX39369.1 MAG: F0F1 ATP synthase subunit delta [Candidatus Sedimenticola endophacoides]OQX43894.1 MAG: F0F1 ATP synthase subunit delta [Candidatus Sedimenticola endophacoides]OQX44380.1 MAG: F0F1 ATP synthase subunit delta [Candidatus Sedimenticola endophacoides]